MILDIGCRVFDVLGLVLLEDLILIHRPRFILT
jgi:hypothetical protein